MLSNTLTSENMHTSCGTSVICCLMCCSFASCRSTAIVRGDDSDGYGDDGDDGDRIATVDCVLIVCRHHILMPSHMIAPLSGLYSLNISDDVVVLPLPIFARQSLTPYSDSHQVATR